MPSRKASPLIDELRPIAKSQAQPSSLSAQHGTGAFPLHTDTAHWRTPARYILLRAVVPLDKCRPTLLLDRRLLSLSASDHCLLKRAVFAVRSGRGSFLTTILPEDEKFFRFDRDCMFPKSSSAGHALSVLASAETSCSPVEIQWARITHWFSTIGDFCMDEPIETETTQKTGSSIECLLPTQTRIWR